MSLFRDDEHMDWAEIRLLLKHAGVKLTGRETHAELVSICGIKAG